MTLRVIAGSANYIECVRETRAQTRLAAGAFSEGRSRSTISST